MQAQAPFSPGSARSRREREREARSSGSVLARLELRSSARWLVVRQAVPAARRLCPKRERAASAASEKREPLDLAPMQWRECSLRTCSQESRTAVADRAKTRCERLNSSSTRCVARASRLSSTHHRLLPPGVQRARPRPLYTLHRPSSPRPAPPAPLDPPPPRSTSTSPPARSTMSRARQSMYPAPPSASHWSALEQCSQALHASCVNVRPAPHSPPCSFEARGRAS